MFASTASVNPLSALEMQSQLGRLNQLSGMHGGLAGALGNTGLGLADRAQMAIERAFNDMKTLRETNPVPKKPQTLREELQAETDEWLKDI